MSEEEVQTLLDETTRWVIKLLEQLERKASILDPEHPQGYENILTAVEEAISERLDQGQWRPTQQ
jgi:hypothetical protein